MYVRPSPNWQGGHILHHNQTNRTITRSLVIATPITSGVIQAIHLQVKLDRMPQTFTFETKLQPWHAIKFAGVRSNNPINGQEQKENLISFNSYQSNENIGPSETSSVQSNQSNNDKSLNNQSSNDKSLQY